VTARSMSLPMLASPRAMDPKEDDGLHVVADRSRTVSVSAVIGSRGTRRGATEKWSSLMVCTPARPMVWVLTIPSWVSAFNASWTVPKH